MPGISQKVYGNSFNLDLAEHYSSTYTKSNFRSQSKSLDLREACILSPSLLLGLLTALKLGVVVGGGWWVVVLKGTLVFCFGPNLKLRFWPRPKLNKMVDNNC